MLTWAWCWFLSHMQGIECGGVVFTTWLTILGDCLITFLVVCAMRGWPK
jgi:hypothetical protein